MDSKAAWQAAVKSGFDYNEKDVAIDKCHNSRNSFIYFEIF